MATLEQLTRRAHARGNLPAPAARRALRQAAGSSLRDVGSVVGVSGECVRLWELGRRTPSAANLEHYVEVLQALRKAVS
jgi:transcriptional regulator with XRE-family HTH domain